jgi:hypothetical protein
LVMPAKFDAAEMPRLDAFDDEFGQDPFAIQREQRRTRVRFWTFVGVGRWTLSQKYFEHPTAQADNVDSKAYSSRYIGLLEI